MKKDRQEYLTVHSEDSESNLVSEKGETVIAGEIHRTIEAAWAKYGRKLYWFVLGMVCSSSDAEDVLQNVFLGLVRSVKKSGEIRNMRAYLYRAVRNESIRNQRMKRHSSGVDIDSLPLLVEAPQSDVDEALDVSQALAKLPLEQREVVVLKLFHDMTFDEIAQMAGITLNTAASRYRYGISKMRRSAEARGEV